MSKEKKISKDDWEVDSKFSVEEKTTRNLTWLYITALTAVAILSITGQWLIQTSIKSLLSDSHVVNLAGTQRYKSQQICKTSILIYADISHNHYPDKVLALKALLQGWREGHLGLQHGSEKLGLPGENSTRINEMFADLTPYHNNIYSGATSIIQLKESGDTSKSKLQTAMRQVLDNEGVFLEKMDAIVHQYDNEAKEKVVVLQRIESILLVVTLLILLVEGFLIFRPVALKIKYTIRDLIISEARASDLARKLMHTNDILERSLKDLSDINYALDNATIVAKSNKFGIISYVNEKFCEISQYSKEELIGNRFGMLSGHYHSKSFFDKLWETVSSGKIWNNEIKNRAKDGSYFWLDATIVPVLDHENTPVQYIAIYTDVTQRFRQSINEQKIKSASIIEGQEKERRKIARELHDGLGQMLTALKFNIEGIKDPPSKKEKLKLDEIKKMLVDTIGEVRKISFNLMPSVLSDFGIVPGIKTLSDQVAKVSSRKIIFENNSTIDRLPKTLEINLYRIVQEALNNAIKYSEADEVKVMLVNDNDYLKLEIADNGKGFAASTINDQTKRNLSGNGISNIQERTSLVDGEFRIETAPGQGTKILIKVPIKNSL